MTTATATTTTTSAAPPYHLLCAQFRIMPINFLIIFEELYNVDVVVCLVPHRMLISYSHSNHLLMLIASSLSSWLRQCDTLTHTLQLCTRLYGLLVLCPGPCPCERRVLEVGFTGNKTTSPQDQSYCALHCSRP